MGEAIRLYSQGLRLRPSWNEGWWWLGSLLYEQDRFPEAQAAFTRFAAISAKPGPAYGFLGLCEYETREYDRAHEHFQAWARKGWPGTPELIDVASFHWALLLTRQGKFVEALYLLATQAGKARNSPGLAEAMGLASLRMASLPEDYPAERREMVWLAGKAALYAALPAREFDRAEEYARRLSVRYGQQPNVHFFRGTLLNFQRRSAEADKEFEEELRISPNHVPAMLELAARDIESNRLAAAASRTKRAIEIEPKNPQAHHLLGRVLLATEHFLESARELETAKLLAPDSALIRSHLAMVYQKLGRRKEAELEAAAFISLKNKEGIFAPPEEKTKVDAQPGRPQR
jgi:tetratricopeptide (TPR) repeat protein